jgi:chromosome segregation ATPase
MNNNILGSIDDFNVRFKRNETRDMDIVENIKKQYEEEIKKIKEEKGPNLANTNNNNNLNNNPLGESERSAIKREDTIKKQNKKIEEMKILLSEERELQNEHILRIKILEETLKKLDKEYENVVNKFTELQKENENFHKTLTDVKRNTGENKHKFEEVISINNELKDKIIQHENSIKTHLDDIKNLLKRNTVLQKQVDVI